MVDAAGALEAVWRSDAAGMRAVLARRLGDLDRAEEALQDAVGEALRRWPVDGVPERPAGWLVTTARSRCRGRTSLTSGCRRCSPLSTSSSTRATTPPVGTWPAKGSTWPGSSPT